MSSALSVLNKNSTQGLDTSSAFEFREDSDEALSWFVYLTSNGTTFMQNSVKIGILYNSDGNNYITIISPTIPIII